ncbi:hypothetical protein ZWY2020_047968 [Hordeum vulgare]|nr:hypothetical protein ZWY2020_047968 [Hordeum vulgare]
MSRRPPDRNEEEEEERMLIARCLRQQPERLAAAPTTVSGGPLTLNVSYARRREPLHISPLSALEVSEVSMQGKVSLRSSRLSARRQVSLSQVSSSVDLCSSLLFVSLQTMKIYFRAGQPSLISQASPIRFDAFVTNLHAYLLAPSIGDAKLLGASTASLSTSSSQGQLYNPWPAASRSSSRTSAANATKQTSIYQASLSPRSSTFKDGVLRTSCAKVVGREAEGQRGLVRPINCSDRLSLQPFTRPASFISLLLPSLYPLRLMSTPWRILQRIHLSLTIAGVRHAHRHCSTVTPPHMPVSSVEPFLKHLCSLVSNEVSSISSFSAKLDTNNLPSLNLPSILHDPSLHLPPLLQLFPAWFYGFNISTFHLPLSHFATCSCAWSVRFQHFLCFTCHFLLHHLFPLHSSQVSTFTPLMSDPISMSQSSICVPLVRLICGMAAMELHSRMRFPGGHDAHAMVGALLNLMISMETNATSPIRRI